MNWHDLRLRYPALQNRIYLNTAACGLVSTGTQAAVQLFWDDLLNSGGKHRWDWEAQIESTRKKLAASLKVPSSQLALIPNFTVGMNYAANLLGKGKKVLLVDQDYASVTLPWQINHYHCELCAPEADGSIPLSKLWKHIQEFQPDILAISHVQWLTGYALPLAELSQLCQQANICLVVDATQSWGMLPIDLSETPVDIFIASGYKWPTAGFGNAVMYVSEKVWQRGEMPVAGSSNLFLLEAGQQPSTTTLPPIGMEAGHHDYPGLIALGQAWYELEEIGFDAIGERVLKLSNYLFDELKRIDWPIVSTYNPTFRSGIMSIKGTEAIVKSLGEQGIDVAFRGGNIRVSIHFYNQKAEIDQLTAALKHIGKAAISTT
ncbi:MAG: aminotransferase class V-fold PLP-dependent enzyme [Bacteroidota bacterium]